jgi:enoyl-CoA hydratase
VKTLRLEKQGPLAIVRLDKPRGNAIDEELLADLRSACAELQRDEALRGVLLASAHPKLFCPGLDLVTLVGYDRAAMERFMTAFSQTVRGLFALERPMVAAVSGHAVAGGCILALCADMRLLRRGAQIGLNEVKVGVPLPWEVAVLLRHSLAPTTLTRVALLGRNFQDADALAVGLGRRGAGARRLRECSAWSGSRSSSTSTRVLWPRPSARCARARSPRWARARPKSAPGWLDAWFSRETRGRIEQIVAGLAR